MKHTRTPEQTTYPHNQIRPSTFGGYIRPVLTGSLNLPNAEVSLEYKCIHTVHTVETLYVCSDPVTSMERALILFLLSQPFIKLHGPRDFCVGGRGLVVRVGLEF